MPSSPVPSGHGYLDIPFNGAERRPLKSVQVYQDGQALNVDLEFEDESMLAMSFRAGFEASVKLLDYEDGNYQLRRKIKPRRSPS